MNLDDYKDQFDALKVLSPHGYEVYRWMIDLGRKLQNDPLSEEKRIDSNRVHRCQFSMFVDKEEDKFKAWSDAIIASGYAYMLVDVFNSAGGNAKYITPESNVFNSAGGNAKYITPESFDLLDIANLLSLNRQNGFYQMVEMIRSRL